MRDREVETYANFKNKWLSYLHRLEEEGEEKRLECGPHTHCPQLEIYEQTEDQVTSFNLGNLLN